MKINQIIVNESSSGTSTAGSVASFAKPLGEVQKRVPVQKTVKKKGPYANSLSEGKVKELSMDLRAGKDGLSDEEFKKKYSKTKAEVRKEMQNKPEPKKEPVKEADLHEEDKIIPIGKGKKLKTGLHGKNVEPKLHGYKAPFVAHGVFVADKRGNKVCDCENDSLAQQVAKALTAYAIANETSIQSGGVIAAGGVGESVQEEKINEKFKSKQQAKLMFAVAGDKDVSKKTGVSQKVAKEFVKKSHGQKVSKLPTKVKSKKD